MGVLPMLQFTTSFTYHMFSRRREALGARPYCLHAIFAHGKEMDRKRAILREERLWHDPPAYYAAPHTNYLVVEPTVPAKVLATGGFDMISTQLRQTQQAMRLAALLNRTLVLPRLRCGERPMAYPCYAWYHRAMAYFGLNYDKVPMPEFCPIYYWLDLARLAQLPLDTRESSFLENVRTPQAVRRSIGKLRLCNKTPCDAAGGRGGAGAAAGSGGDVHVSLPRRLGAANAALREVHVPGSASVAEVIEAARSVGAVRVLRVQHIHALALADYHPLSHPPPTAPNARKGVAALQQRPRLPTRQELEAVTHGYWCTACPITRRGAVIHELNRSTVRELETFCKTEVRGRLGIGHPPPPQQSCCPRPVGNKVGACHTCRPNERRAVNESTMSWAMRAWAPIYARLELPSGRSGPSSGGYPLCTHPLCTGTDRKRHP
jgi:hypothetical protein